MTRIFKVVAAIGLLAALYWHCDWRRVAEAMAELDPACLGWAFLLFVPQTLVSAWRWRWLTAPLCRISLSEAVRHTLAASAWNLAAPSKLGDLTKAAMLPLEIGDRRRAWMLVLIEKAADVAALALVWLAGAAWRAGSGWLVMAALLALLTATTGRGLMGFRTPHSAFRISSASLLLWLLHLAQIHLMLLAAGVNVGFDVSLARVPAAIFAGLAPLTLCGIGTRDGALIWLFSDVAPAGTMAAVGLLTATRYLVPGAVGIAMIGAHAPKPQAAIIR
jgi:hypothetical protein